MKQYRNVQKCPWKLNLKKTRVNPILQVTLAHGGQYKYNGHTICFPQDITKIANMLSRRVEHLDILIVTRHSNDHKAYDFIVSRHRVLAALEYNLANDPYYKNVRIDTNALASLPAIPADVSSSFTIPILQKPLSTFHLNHHMSSLKIPQTHL